MINIIMDSKLYDMYCIKKNYQMERRNSIKGK